MTWPRKVSDRALVESADRFEKRWRKCAAILILTLSLTYVALAVWLYRLVSTGIYPVQTELFDEAHRDWFEIGLCAGFLAGKIFFFSVYGAIAGCYLLTSQSGRQRRLLVKLFERLDRLGELDQVGQLKSEQ